MKCNKLKGKVMKASTAFLVASLMLIVIGCGSNQELDVAAILESELFDEHDIVISQSEVGFDAGLGDEFDVLFNVSGDYGRYFFTPGEWTDELILSLVQIGEEGTRFVNEWLESETDELPNFIFNITKPDDDHFLPIWGGGVSFGNFAYISMEPELLPSIVIHEAVHEILQHNEIMSNFPQTPDTSTWHGTSFLEEGLCDVLDFMFFMETDLPYDEQTYGSDKQEAIGFLHERALSFDFFDFEDEAEYGLHYAQLMSYETAASFVYYLLEYKGSKEDFLRFFEDIYLAEEIYGNTLDELIESWMVYLDALR